MQYINRYTNKTHTHVLRQKKEKGGIAAISVAANRVFMSLNKLGHGGSRSLHGSLGPLRGTE